MWSSVQTLVISSFVQAVREAMGRLGLGNNSFRADDPEGYLFVLKGAISVNNELNIIEVGANDGKHNDPIYDFVKSNKKKTNIVLIEPIKTLIPYLKENYSFHPSAEIFNKAISGGNSSSISLYRIKKNYWSDIDADYGDDWPDYRIPTGVTTSDKNQLIHWVSQNVRTSDSPQEIIEQFNVDVISPSSVINQSQNIDSVHLLQVDAEGMDDEIVYSFLDSNIYPNIINIETSHLRKEQQEMYVEKLSNYGYKLWDYTDREILAIKT